MLVAPRPPAAASHGGIRRQHADLVRPYRSLPTSRNRTMPSTSPCRWTRSSASISAAIRPSPCCWRRRRAATRSPITRPTGWRCATTSVFATVQRSSVRDASGDHFTLGEPRARDARRLRRRPAAPGSAVRPRLHHGDASARAHASEDAGGQRSGACAQRAGKAVRHRVSRPDAADADHAATATRSTRSAPSTATSS